MSDEIDSMAVVPGLGQDAYLSYRWVADLKARFANIDARLKALEQKLDTTNKE